MRRASFSWFELRWPHQVTADQALELALALHAVSGVVIELQGTQRHVLHRVGVPGENAARLRRRLVTVLPELAIIDIERTPTEVSFAWQVIRQQPFGLVVDRAEQVARGLFSVFGAVALNEAITLQVLLQNTLGPTVVPEDIAAPLPSSWPAAVGRLLTVGTEPMPSRERTRLQQKWALPGWQCSLRIGVVAGDRRRARRLADDALGVLRQAEGPGAHLVLRRARRALVRSVRPSWFTSGSINAAELPLIAGWPIGNVGTAPLVRQTHRLLMPTGAEPATGTILAGAPDKTPLRMTPQMVTHSLHVVGPIGSGKSATLANLIAQDMEAGLSVVVVDGKGDLFRSCLSLVPSHRLDDVVIIDPSDPVAVTAVNPLRGGDPEMVADAQLAVMLGLYGDIGRRSQDIFHAAMLTLASVGDASIVMLLRLLTDDGFRRSVVGRLRDPVLLGFWRWYESVPDQSVVIAPLSNKWRPLVYRTGLRRMFGYRHPKFDLRQLFSERKIVLVNTSAGHIGPVGSSLAGALFVSALWRQIERQVETDPKHRRPVNVYCDEFQDYVRLPIDLTDALVKARGFNTSFCLSHQLMRQLDSSLAATVLGNVRNRLVFATGADDAMTFARASGGLLRPDDFQALPPYEVYIQLSGIGWRSGTTHPEPSAISDPEAVRRRSHTNYGTPIEIIDADLAEQLGHDDDQPPSPIGGRKRRP